MLKKQLGWLGNKVTLKWHTNFDTPQCTTLVVPPFLFSQTNECPKMLTKTRALLFAESCWLGRPKKRIFFSLNLNFFIFPWIRFDKNETNYRKMRIDWKKNYLDIRALSGARRWLRDLKHVNNLSWSCMYVQQYIKICCAEDNHNCI